MEGFVGFNPDDVVCMFCGLGPDCLVMGDTCIKKVAIASVEAEKVTEEEASEEYVVVNGSNLVPGQAMYREKYFPNHPHYRPVLIGYFRRGPVKGHGKSGGGYRDKRRYASELALGLSAKKNDSIGLRPGRLAKLRLIRDYNNYDRGYTTSWKDSKAPKQYLRHGAKAII